MFQPFQISIVVQVFHENQTKKTTTKRTSLKTLNFLYLQVIDKMASFIERFNDSILQGSKSLKGPKMAALTSFAIVELCNMLELLSELLPHPIS